MKPHFALNLSQDGIGLLHRTKGGWNRVGDIALDDADFSDALKMLRSTASALEAGGVLSKLVLPGNQILYTTVPLAPGPKEAQKAAIRTALKGATPYDVDDLVFDWHLSGETAQVAVVARETLAEAEAFAVEHRFNPVSFVGAPQPGQFTGEPWFGMTEAAAALIPKGEVIDRDRFPVRAAKTKPRTAPTGNAGPDDGATARTEEPEDPPAPPAEPAPEAASPPQTGKQAREPAAPPQEPLQISPLSPPETRPNFVTSRAQATPIGPMPLMPSRLTLFDASAGDAPRLGGAERNVGVTAAAAPIPAVAPSGEPIRKPERKTRLKSVPSKNANAAPKATAARAPARDPNRKQITAKPVPVTARIPPRVVAPKSAAPVTTTAIAPGPSRDEAEALTVFGARSAQHGPRKPRYLGLILTAALLLIMAAAALWSALFISDDVALLPDASVVPALPSISAPPPAAGGQTAAREQAPQLATLPAPGLSSPAPEASSPPALAPEARAPAVSSPAALAPVVADVAPTEPDPSPEGLAPEPEPVTGPQVVETPPPRAPETQALTQPPATLWITAPEVPSAPSMDRISGLYIASIDPAIAGVDATALPATGGLKSDTALPVQPLPPAAGQVFRLNTGGLVTPSPEGTLNPEGVLVFSGKPSLVPPPRPDNGAGLAAQADAAEHSRLAALRPRPRPASSQDTGGASDNSAADDTSGPLVITSSRVPVSRPAGHAQNAEAALAASNVAAVPASAAITPSIPSNASVAKQATFTNSINLRKMNLIGVFGSASDRRALVRLPTGKFVKVQVGDRINGGKVAAISATELRYVKNGRNIVLEMPQG